MKLNDRYLAFMGLGPKRMPHWEHWSCPDAETYLTGIDYYENPKQCRLKLQELYPELGLGIPDSDDTRPRPELDLGEHSSATDDRGIEECPRAARGADGLRREPGDPRLSPDVGSDRERPGRNDCAEDAVAPEPRTQA